MITAPRSAAALTVTALLFALEPAPASAQTPAPAQPPPASAAPEAPNNAAPRSPDNAAPGEAAPGPAAPAAAATNKPGAEAAPAGPAAADPPAEPELGVPGNPALAPPPGAIPPPLPPIERDEKRAVPDYDGRGDDPTTTGDVVVWVPRVLLSPLYLVSEFVVRRPLGAFVTWAEREQIPALLLDVFTFGPDQNAGIVPTGLIDFGFRPSIGLYFFYNDWIPSHNLRARAATGGPGWLMLNLRDRLVLGEEDEISLGGGFVRRSDWVFHGLGPRSPSERYRFASTTLQADLTYEARLWRSSGFTSFVGVRRTTFDPEDGCCDSTVLTGLRRGLLAEPPGMMKGYTLFLSGLSADLDTRPRRDGSGPIGPAGHGVRLNVRGEHAAAVGRQQPFTYAEPERYHFVKYGATVTGYLDITGLQRVVSLSAIVDFADPLREDGSIPFTEQITLGGERPMVGYLAGRLVDRSSAVARLDYTWPIWVWLDGALHYEVGNVFGERLQGFDLELLRNSFGMGMRASSSSDHVFEMLLAFGTETFAAGSQIENVRFVLGATSGF